MSSAIQNSDPQSVYRRQGGYVLLYLMSPATGPGMEASDMLTLALSSLCKFQPQIVRDCHLLLLPLVSTVGCVAPVSTITVYVGVNTTQIMRTIWLIAVTIQPQMIPLLFNFFISLLGKLWVASGKILFLFMIVWLTSI